MEIKQFGPKELEILEKIKKNDIQSPAGLIKALALVWSLVLAMSVTMICLHFNLAIPHGPILFQITVFGGLALSVYQLLLIIALDTQFIQAMAERTGFEVVCASSILSQNRSQLFDKETKTYYRIIPGLDGVTVRSIKEV